MKKFLCLLATAALFVTTACAVNPQNTDLPSGSEPTVSATDSNTDIGLPSTDSGVGSASSGNGSNSSQSTQNPTDTPSSTNTGGNTGTNSTTNTSTDTDSNTKPPVDVPEKTVSDMVIACDQTTGRIVVYDLDKYDGKDLENCAVWDYAPPPKSETVHRSKLVSGVKYRTGTVFGDVMIFVASGRYASIVTYPGKKVIWKDEWSKKDVSEKNKGVNNPHSIEILPSGNTVVAGSTGNMIRIFYTSALVDDPDASVSDKSATFPLEDAHGVLWDPKYQCLWAIGGHELVSYKLSGSGTSETLVKDKTYTLPSPWGHDLSADALSKDHLWLTTGSSVYRFDKTKGTFTSNFEHYQALRKSAVKGFGNNVNGHFFFCYPNNGAGTSWSGQSFASWCTNTITYGYYNDSGAFKIKTCLSKSAAFYKVVAFRGEYQ